MRDDHEELPLFPGREVRDVVEHIVSRETLGLTVEGARDELGCFGPHTIFRVEIRGLPTDVVQQELPRRCALIDDDCVSEPFTWADTRKHDEIRGGIQCEGIAPGTIACIVPPDRRQRDEVPVRPQPDPPPVRREDR